MSTYVLIPGAGGDAWYWHRVVPLLQELGHDVIVPELPWWDPTATWEDYRGIVVDAVAGRNDVVIVAVSLGGFLAPLVAERTDASLIVLAGALVPLPGETVDQWWAASGHPGIESGPDVDLRELGFHDVPAELTDVALQKLVDADGEMTPPSEPLPLRTWPDVPTRYIVMRNDRCLPADVMRRQAVERLHLEPDTCEAGHCPALSHPAELVALAEAYRTGHARRG